MMSSGSADVGTGAAVLSISDHGLGKPRWVHNSVVGPLMAAENASWRLAHARPDQRCDATGPPADAAVTLWASNQGVRWMSTRVNFLMPMDTFREHRHSGAFPPQPHDREHQLGRSRAPRLTGPSGQPVTAPGCHGQTGHTERRFIRFRAGSAGITGPAQIRQGCARELVAGVPRRDIGR
jgi:hypothetical protein